MTDQEILIQLLEEAQKYQYEQIEVLCEFYWKELENVSLDKKIFHPGRYYNQRCRLTRGVLIRLIGVPEIDFSGTDNSYAELALTVGALTTIYQRNSDTIYICLEI